MRNDELCAEELPRRIHASSLLVVSTVQWVDVDYTAEGFEFDRCLAGVRGPHEAVRAGIRSRAPGFGSKGNFRIAKHFALYGLRIQLKRTVGRNEDIHVSVPGGKLIVSGRYEVAFKNNLARGGVGAQVSASGRKEIEVAAHGVRFDATSRAADPDVAVERAHRQVAANIVHLDGSAARFNANVSLQPFHVHIALEVMEIEARCRGNFQKIISALLLGAQPVLPQKGFEAELFGGSFGGHRLHLDVRPRRGGGGNKVDQQFVPSLHHYVAVEVVQGDARSWRGIDRLL